MADHPTRAHTKATKKCYVLVTHGTAIDNPGPNSKPNCFHGRPFCPRQKTRNDTYRHHIGRYVRILYALAGVVQPGSATPAVPVACYKIVVSGLCVRARNGTICLLHKTNGRSQGRTNENDK